MGEEPQDDTIRTTIGPDAEPATEVHLWGKVVVADRLLTRAEEDVERVIDMEIRGLASDMRTDLEQQLFAVRERMMEPTL